MRRRAAPVCLGVLAVCAVALVASNVWAQAKPPSRQPLDPQQLQLPRRAPLTLTPTLTIAEEFNDNILLNNDDKRWDFITSFTPGITLQWAEPTASIVAGYSFTADLYARNPHLNHAFDAHNFFADARWQPTSRWTLTASDTFGFSTNTNLVSAEGIATGRDRAFGNALAVGASWQATPRTTLRGSASWTIQRYASNELQDSDVYRAEVGVDRVLTPRWTGSLGYEVGFFNIQREVDVTTHIPKIGTTYRFTETLTGTVSGGPGFEIPDEGDTHIVPVVSANLRQRFQWGSAGVDYSQYIGTAGGLGGTTVNQSFGATAQVITLLKGLVVDVGPRFSWVKSHDNRIDVRSFTLPVRATWRFTAWAAAVASYSFFYQRVERTILSPSGIPLANDVDQNRVTVGLEFGYPIRFE